MIKQGTRVKVHYTGTLDDGTVFDSSYMRGEPLEFTLGSRKMLFDFEQAVARLTEGATCKIHLTPLRAYGPWYDNQIDSVPLEKFGGKTPPIGQLIQMRAGRRMVRAKVVRIENGAVVLDYNHPLAGQNVNFEITLVEVEHKDALAEEQEAHGCSCHRVAESLAHAHHEHTCECC